MLDLKFIRENPDQVKNALLAKGYSSDSLDELLRLDLSHRSCLKELEDFRHRMNQSAKQIGLLKAKGEAAPEKMEATRLLSQKIKDLELKVVEIYKKLDEIIYVIPNIPHKSVPIGKSADENVEIKSWGEKPKFDFEPLPHWEIGERLGILDFKRASKITGTGFVLYKGLGARLERALIQFMIDLHTQSHGYTEISPPFVVNRKSMIGTGQLPKLEKDMYCIKDDDRSRISNEGDLFLIPTAEVPLTNLFMDEVLEEKDLPIALTAYTPCFRREAGSYGRDTRGMIRVHQFDKVELVRFTRPEDSYDELEKLLGHAETVLQKLGFHYRVKLLCSGDMSFAAAKCYDIEVWAAAQGRYLEVSSCSNFEDFQARRANIKFKRGTGNGKRETQFVHTLNGSGIALARTVVALLENGQRKDGTVALPPALIPYMGRIEELK